MTPVVAGLAAGVATALFPGQAIRAVVRRAAGDAMTIGVVAALACLEPAQRAAGTDAIAALRFE